MMINKKRSFRLYEDVEQLSGVCAGIAYYFGVPLWLVRLITLLLIISLCGWPLVVYICLALVVPKDRCAPDDFRTRTS